MLALLGEPFCSASLSFSVELAVLLSEPLPSCDRCADRAGLFESVERAIVSSRFVEQAVVFSA